MDPIDQLLSNLTPSSATPIKPLPKPLPKPLAVPVSEGSIDQLLERLGEPQQKPICDSLRSPSIVSSPPIAQPSLATIVPEVVAYATQQAAAQVQQRTDEAEAQRQAILKQQRQEELRMQAQQELRTKAEQWLASLDRKSTEGRWFEEFGCNYASPLEAAIAYLEALQEVDHFLG